MSWSRKATRGGHRDRQGGGEPGEPGQRGARAAPGGGGRRGPDGHGADLDRAGGRMRPHTDVTVGAAPGPGIDLAGIPADQALGWLDTMLLIREFESRRPLATSGAIPGGMHAAIGQEAVAVGVMSVLSADDVAAAPHRSHHIAPSAASSIAIF